MARKPQGRYAEKRERGLVPHRYDRDSKRFQSGAWKNLTKAEAACNRAAVDKHPRRGCGKAARLPLRSIQRRAHGHVFPQR